MILISFGSLHLFAGNEKKEILDENRLRLASAEPPLKVVCKILEPPYELILKPESDEDLRFSYGVRPEAWEKDDNAFVFKVVITERRKGKTLKNKKIVFQKRIKPKSNILERGWNESRISLKKYKNKEILVQFSSEFVKHDDEVVSIVNPTFTSWGAIRVGSFTRKSGEYNVILISLDTLRADHVGINGYFRNTTPNLDRIAREGIFFREAVAQSPWTKPSHMSVFTSLFPSFHGVNRSWRLRNPERLSEDKTTLTQILQLNGYITRAFVSTGQIGPRFGFDIGFDHYGEGGSAVEKTFIPAFSWLKKNANDKFFLFLHTYEIHRPFTRTHFLEDLVNPSKQEKSVARYDSDIRRADLFVGKLFMKLEELKISSNTIVVIMSDHGEDLASHYKDIDHGHTLYEEIIRVPLWFYCPPLLKPRIFDKYQAQHIDISPTILDLLSIPHSQFPFQGKSLINFFNGTEVVPNETFAVSEALASGPERKSVRKISEKEKLKLIIAPQIEKKFNRYVKGKIYQNNFDPNAPWSKDAISSKGRQFFNLISDPNEKKNLALIKGKEQLELEEKLLEYLDSVPDDVHVDELGNKLEPDVEEALRSLGY